MQHTRAEGSHQHKCQGRNVAQRSGNNVEAVMLSGLSRQSINASTGRVAGAGRWRRFTLRQFGQSRIRQTALESGLDLAAKGVG